MKCSARSFSKEDRELATVEIAQRKSTNKDRKLTFA
jgi:hypothetical protein